MIRRFVRRLPRSVRLWICEWAGHEVRTDRLNTFTYCDRCLSTIGPLR